MKTEDLLFARTHEWVRLSDDGGTKLATVGISEFAVQQLTDLVYLELPSIGQPVEAGQPIGEIESVKAVSDLYSPVTGEVVEVNASLKDNLEVFAQDPYGAGWMMKVRVTDPSSIELLLDPASYARQCAEEA